MKKSKPSTKKAPKTSQSTFIFATPFGEISVSSKDSKTARASVEILVKELEFHYDAIQDSFTRAGASWNHKEMH